ncbi:MAG: beta-galactosidase [Firmicutes bacterium]|nr:beta-galactosidase [Bacillota bacterium]
MIQKKNGVSLDKRGIKINGQYKILLCASLFYFRIPAGLWRDRMRKIRTLGYNCIDVYFPWNYHELRKGEWSFSNQRDVDLFLTMAKEEGLFVIARPGPYICSEWDGGGLPAYLFAEDQMKIRDNDPKYLSYVSQWYDRILPIISRHQVTCGGAVILVQLENELDFFECEDRHGYMKALKEMADKYNIEVPCIACTGQGDIYGAWGMVDSIVPSMNFYLNSRLINLEQEIENYVNQLGEMEIPLMVTETGREHLLLRRLLASGAKLLSPYNQVAGTDFGFTNSVNNWGQPVSFQTSNYGFGSLVDSFGKISEEAHEARLLAGFINAMGQPLAGALKLYENHEFEVKADGLLGCMKVPVLSLLQEKYAGYAVSITNIDEKIISAVISRRGEYWPKKTKMKIPPGKSRFVLFDFELSNWGLPGRIAFASAEPCFVIPGDTTVIVFHADEEGEVQFIFDENDSSQNYIFIFNGEKDTREEILLTNGKKIILYGVSSKKAPILSHISGDNLHYFPPGYFNSEWEQGTFDIKWAKAIMENEKIDLDLQPVYWGKNAIHMEKAGLYRGYGWYEGHAVLAGGKKPLGILLHNAADVVSVYCNGKYLDTLIPVGSYEFIDLGKNISEDDFYIVARTEIWGHSNFDDSQKPALRIKSLRGLDGATLITERQHLHFWGLKIDYRKKHICENPYEIKIPFGSWLTTHKPVQCSYYRKFQIPENVDHCFLYFEKIQCNAIVHINGKLVGEVDAYNNYLDISPFINERKEVEVCVTLYKRHYSEASGKVYLLAGTAFNDWLLAGCQEEELWRNAYEKFSGKSVPTKLPFTMEPGSITWLFGKIEPDSEHPCHVLKFKGQNAKLTVFFNGNIVGRIWLPSPNRPVMAGGIEDLAYLPGCWFRKDGNNYIIIMVEAISKDQPAVIDTMESKR